MTTLAGVLRDGSVMTWRNLLNVRRIPGRVITAVVQPIMFVLLFAYVFGGSLGGASYREFLMGGIFAQAMTFNAAVTTIGLAGDVQQGIVDRFRTLPMSRVGVILGRTVSDLVVGMLTLAVTVGCGLVVGWRVRTGPLEALAAVGLLLLFAFALCWVGASIALFARSVEVAQSAGLIWLFPVTLISTAFVSAQDMPAPLRVIAQWNPVSAVASAVRELAGNPVPAALAPPAGWPSDNAVLYAALSSIGIIVVFGSAALWRYRRLGRG